jgi:hypothetical protein
MDILTDLSIKIAEATVPDEVDLAPLMTDAFIRGGKEKESLFAKQESAELGAFGLVDGIVLFPWILKGIAIASPFILQILSMDNDYISTISDSLNICDKLKMKEKVVQLPGKHSKTLTNIFDKFASELKASGLPEEQCDRIIANVLVTLLKDPSVSLVFVEKIAVSK